MKKQILPAVSVLVLIVIDQYSKELASTFLSVEKNFGIAFGIPIPTIVTILFSVLLLVILLFIAKKELNLRKPTALLSVVLVFAGGISNLIDRVYYGYVVDFIKIWIWPTFNIADIYITAGILLIILHYAKIKKV